MALVFSDSFDSYAATADLTTYRKWSLAASPWTWGSAFGRNGGGGMQVATTGGAVLKSRAGVFSSAVTCGGFWMKMTGGLPTGLANFLIFRDASDSALGFLRLTTGGFLNLNSVFGGSVATGLINVCDGNWHWIETIIRHAVNSNQQLRVDGTQEWNGTLSAGNGTAANRFEFVSIASRTLSISWPIFYDDSTGVPTSANFPLGPRQITTVRPQADSAVSFLTATGGSTHFNQVNEVAADGDATYVESAVSGDQDLYDFTAMGISPASITTVMMNAVVENPNPGVINFRQIVTSGATQTDGASIAVPSSYQAVQQSFPLDPNTGLAWASASAVDSATLGIKVA